MVNIDLGNLNLYAILAAGVVSWIVGGAWYSRPLLGRRWMQLVGVSEEQAGEGAMVGFILALVLGIVTAFFLAMVLQALDATTVLDGVVGGLLVWFGFMAIPAVSTIFFAKRPASLWAINQGYNAIAFILMGIILAVWV